jgi:hypothetical protein
MGRPKVLPEGVALIAPFQWHWTPGQIATWHQMSVVTVTAAIKRGELEAVMLAKGYQISHEAYLKWYEACKVKRLEVRG